MASQSYNAGNIQVLEGLEAVRLRTGMYIGTTSSRGLHHLLQIPVADGPEQRIRQGFPSGQRSEQLDILRPRQRWIMNSFHWGRTT